MRSLARPSPYGLATPPRLARNSGCDRPSKRGENRAALVWDVHDVRGLESAFLTPADVDGRQIK